MIIENKKKVILINLQLFVVTVVAVTAIITVIILGVSHDEVPVFLRIEPSTVYFYVAIFFIFYILYLIFLRLKNYHYFFYSDEESVIIIRYYRAWLFSKKFKAFQIQKDHLVNFTLVKSNFGLSTNIIITIKTTKGIANYPPVSITGLTSLQIEKLKASLRKYCISK